MTREELIARLEHAEAPSRELDAAIAIHLDGATAEDLAYVLTDIEGTLRPPRYTASIDAALTLVPGRCDMISFRSDPSGSGWELGEFTGGEYIKHSEGATGGLWAIALCIASLKARDGA